MKDLPLTVFSCLAGAPFPPSSGFAINLEVSSGHSSSWERFKSSFSRLHMEEISVKPRMAQFLPRSQCVFMLFRPVAQHWKRWATPPLALWKLSCRSTPISPLSAEQAAIRLVFPAQSGSKLWPSLCAFRNPAHCHSDSLPCFSNSICPCALSHLVLVPQHHSDPLSTHRTSCSRYSDIWERFSNLKHLNYCTADPAQQENASAGANRPAEATRQDLLDVTVGGEDICTF